MLQHSEAELHMWGRQAILINCGKPWWRKMILEMFLILNNDWNLMLRHTGYLQLSNAWIQSVPNKTKAFSATFKKSLFAIPVGSSISIPSKSVNSQPQECNQIALNCKIWGSCSLCLQAQQLCRPDSLHPLVIAAVLRATVNKTFCAITVPNTVIFSCNQFPSISYNCIVSLDIYVTVFCPYGNYKTWP